MKLTRSSLGRREGGGTNVLEGSGAPMRRSWSYAQENGDGRAYWCRCRPVGVGEALCRGGCD